MKKMSYRQRKKVILKYCSFLSAVLVTIFWGTASLVFARDHPSHMITAAIAFEEIERLRPDLMERLGHAARSSCQTTVRNTAWLRMTPR